MKTLANQAARGSIAMAGSQAIASVASFVIVWAVARGLGDTAYGIFAAAYALATSVASLADSGVRLALIREVARSPSSWHKLWFYAMVISLVLAIIVSLGFVGIILFEESLASQTLRLWLLAYALLWTLMRISLGVPAGQQRLVAVAVWGAFERVSGAVFMLWLAFFEQNSLLTLAQGLCILEAGVLLLLVVWIFRQGWSTSETEQVTVTSFAKVALPFGASAAAFAILGRLDLIVLGFQQPPELIGHYAAAQLLAMIGIFVGVSISGALFPALSQLGKAKEVENSRRLVRPAIGLLTLMMVLLAMLLSTLSSWLLGYVYGDDYTQGASWLILFALVAPFMAINSVAGAVIGAWGWQGRWAKTLWYLLPIVAVMYVLMSTEFGVWGVALVGVGYQLTMTMITWRWMSKEGIVDSRWLMSLLGLTGALALLFVCVPEHLYWLSLPLAIIGIFALSICKASWIKMAFRVVR